MAVTMTLGLTANVLAITEGEFDGVEADLAVSRGQGPHARYFEQRN
jgi:hypothetical protein